MKSHLEHNAKKVTIAFGQTTLDEKTQAILELIAERLEENGGQNHPLQLATPVRRRNTNQAIESGSNGNVILRFFQNPEELQGFIHYLGMFIRTLQPTQKIMIIPTDFANLQHILQQIEKTPEIAKKVHTLLGTFTKETIDATLRMLFLQYKGEISISKKYLDDLCGVSDAERALTAVTAPRSQLSIFPSGVRQIVTDYLTLVTLEDYQRLALAQYDEAHTPQRKTALTR